MMNNVNLQMFWKKFSQNAFMTTYATV